MVGTSAAVRYIDVGPYVGDGGKLSPQEVFLSTPADFAIYGGAAGSGKSRALLLECLRHIDNPKFRVVLFRRTSPQIRNPGGLWDSARELYPLFGAYGREQELEWVFPSGAVVKFAHLQHESDVDNWQGSELALVGFDELTQFTERQFWFLALARGRSLSGVQPYIRATCNPDAESFVASLVAWWIDQDTGYPIPERAGVLRWFYRIGDALEWFDSAEEARSAHPELASDGIEPKSLTFVPGKLDDNPELVRLNPGYRGSLKALPLVDRERLLGGNWKIRPAAGMVFRKEWFPIVDAAPAAGERIRFWDLAATEPSVANPDPDWTVGVRLLKTYGAAPEFYVEDVIRMRATSAKVEAALKNTASLEPLVRVGLFRDPAQAGKWQAEYLVKLLAGRTASVFPIGGDKLTLAGPVSAQCEIGNVKLVRGAWNKPFLDILESFDGSGKGHDDDVDALSGAFNALMGAMTVDYSNLNQL